MNQHQLKCFLTVAETLSFANAAKVLNLSQPAVSRQIKSLEDELGVTLFHRNTRTVMLTSYGHNFYSNAKNIYNQMLAAISGIRHDTAAFVPVLRIGCCNNADLDVMTEILQRCREQYSTIHPYLQIIQRKRLLNMLLNDNLDAAFGFKEDFETENDLIYKHLFYVEICCVISNKHPAAAQKTISQDQLYQEKPILCYATDLPSTVSHLQKQLEYRYSTNNIYYSDDVLIALSFVRAGYGYCILPDLQSPYEQGLAYLPLEGHAPLSYGIYYRKNKKNDLLKMLLRILK